MTYFARVGDMQSGQQYPINDLSVLLFLQLAKVNCCASGLLDFSKYISVASTMTVVPLYISLGHWGLWSSMISLSGNIFNSLNPKKTNLIQVVRILLTRPWDILNLQARSSSSTPTLQRHKRRKTHLQLKEPFEVRVSLLNPILVFLCYHSLI